MMLGLQELVFVLGTVVASAPQLLMGNPSVLLVKLVLQTSFFMTF